MTSPDLPLFAEVAEEVSAAIWHSGGEPSLSELIQPILSRRLGPVVEALKGLMNEKRDYMRRNLLGDPEKEHWIVQGAKAIADLEQPK